VYVTLLLYVLIYLWQINDDDDDDDFWTLNDPSVATSVWVTLLSVHAVDYVVLSPAFMRGMAHATSLLLWSRVTRPVPHLHHFLQNT